MLSLGLYNINYTNDLFKIYAYACKLVAGLAILVMIIIIIIVYYINCNQELTLKDNT